MFTEVITPFGGLQKYTLADTDSGNSFSIIPGYGACLTELVFGGVSLLDSYATYEELIENKWSKSAFLFPFPNRLKDGVYHFDNVRYQFPVNNPATGNAIHGYGKSLPMEVSDVICDNDKAQVRCTYTGTGDHPAYPFPFTFSVLMTITNQNTFEVEMSFRNTGAGQLPVGLGWHPYFRIAGNTDEVKMQLPACHKVIIDHRMIPTGEKQLFEDFEQENSLAGTTLDNCFEVPAGNGRFEMYLRSPLGKLSYWQETGPGKYPFLQLFTPDHRQSVAIEPMTCNVDAFNNGDGLLILEKGGAFEGKLGLGWNS